MLQNCNCSESKKRAPATTGITAAAATTTTTARESGCEKSINKNGTCAALAERERVGERAWAVVYRECNFRSAALAATWEEKLLK